MIMGTLRSMTDHTGLDINGITLGQPVQDTDDEGVPLPGAEYRWDDARLPAGVLLADGTVVPDDMEVGL